ncbi:MAG TPA: hypothetical protein VGB82_00035 [Alphaproteobacteria bacterium]
MSDDKVGRDIAREHLEAIEAALGQAMTRLSQTKVKFERSFREHSDPSDPGRIALELEQAGFELERVRLQALRDAAKAHYLKSFAPRKA